MTSKAHRLYITVIVLLLCMNAALYTGKTKSYTLIEEEHIQGVEHTDGPINLNRATKDELMTIDGIGPVTADKILARRRELGGRFNAVEDLLSVEGISEKRFKRFKEMLYVEE